MAETDKGTSITVASRFRVTHDNEEIIVMTRDEGSRKESPLLRLTSAAARYLGAQLLEASIKVKGGPA